MASYTEGLLLVQGYLSTRKEQPRLEAIALLWEAVAQDPENAGAHAALASLLGGRDASAAEAVAEWRSAHTLAPKNPVFEMNLLVAAARFSVGKRKLAATDFASASNAFAAWVHDEVERLSAQEPSKRSHEPDHRDADDYSRIRDQLAESFREDRVPEELAPLIPLALRYGHGDDGCRGYFARTMPARDRIRLRAAMEASGESVHRWLDSFEAGQMPPEAAAFMYLLLVAEEHGVATEAAPSTTAKPLSRRKGPARC